MTTQTATRRGAKPAAVHTPQVIEIEVGRTGKTVLDRLANARITRLLAEKVEAPLKEKARALWADAAVDLRKDDVLIVKAQGVVRGRVTVRDRAKVIDLGLLQAAFPEAYERCVSDNASAQFEPC